MANYAIQSKRLGLTKESVRGTVETTPASWLAISPDSELSFVRNLLADVTLRGVGAEFAGAPGSQVGSGNIKFPLRANKIGEFFNMLIGAPVSAEATAFTVTVSSNDKIDFTEDGGAELTATLTPGSYAMGTTSATAGTLCALIKTQLEAVNGASTYTVTYSYSTKKVTITKNSGVFVIKWATGTNTATSARTLLGFTNADTASAIAATSDSTTQFAMTHTFTPAGTVSLPSYTLFLDRSLGVLKYNFGIVSSMKLASAPNGFVDVDNSIMFQNEASGSIGSPVYTDESEELGYQHVSLQIAGGSNTEVKSWNIDLMNGLFAKFVSYQQAFVYDLLAVKDSVTGSFVIYFANTTERDKFLASSTSSIQLTIAGDAIQGTTKYTVDILVDQIQYTAFPYGEADGLLAANVNFKGVYYSTNSRIYRVAVTNIKASY